MSINAPKGTRDILPKDIYNWRSVENLFIETCEKFGYAEIRIPVFEYTELFHRGVGETTDIVNKEMYTFNDKGGRSLTLRPEGTAGIVRSYIQNGMASMPQPVKLFYNITAYRYENVQKGRYREFHQLGAELFGSGNSSADVEIISLLNMFFENLNIRNLSLEINSIGCPKCRKTYNKKLYNYFEARKDNLCHTCNDRMERNPLRILDCKVEVCRNVIESAPLIIDHICEACSNHFDTLKGSLDAIGILYTVNPRIVRGLDYYTRTVFEFISNNIGSQGTVCGGGRYDGLVEECGGKGTPGVGFSLGVERLMLELESQEIQFHEEKDLSIYIGAIGEEGNNYAEKLAYQIRKSGIHCQKDISNRSIKAQMKYANKLKMNYLVIIGDDEIASGKAELKNMNTGESKEISIDTLVDRMKRNIQKDK